jgi:hypothetical protein
LPTSARSMTGASRREGKRLGRAGWTRPNNLRTDTDGIAVDA